MIFASLEIGDWRQFKQINIAFHRNLTILTGANSSGKTSLLNVLGQHLNWSTTYYNTFRRGKNTSNSGSFSSGRSTGPKIQNIESGMPGHVFQGDVLGKLSYSNGVTAVIYQPPQASQAYSLGMVNMQTVKGTFIPAHKPVYGYQQVANIPTQLLKRDAIYQNYQNAAYIRYTGQSSSISPIYAIKEALISLAVFGEGNSFVTRDEESLELFLGFEEILHKILPESLEFQRFSIDVPEVNLVTKSGTFPIDSVSGGVAALIDMAWRIYTRSLPLDEFV